MPRKSCLSWLLVCLLFAKYDSLGLLNCGWYCYVTQQSSTCILLSISAMFDNTCIKFFTERRPRSRGQTHRPPCHKNFGQCNHCILNTSELVLSLSQGKQRISEANVPKIGVPEIKTAPVTLRMRARRRQPTDQLFVCLQDTFSGRDNRQRPGVIDNNKKRPMPAPRVSRGDMSKSDSLSFSTPNTSPGGQYVTRLVIIRNRSAPRGSICVAFRRIGSDQCVGRVASIFTSLVFDAGTVLGSVATLSCAGFMCCHCTGRWAVLDNTHVKDSGAFC